jgi:glyoxylase-like metal-dependent hydrolase (beta-lactamase superfamily II)
VIRVETDPDVVFVRLARGIAGRPIFWTGVYYLEGLLVDCGPPATARELLAWLGPRPLEAVLLTHHHEDHIGAAPLLQQQRGLVPRAHAAGLPLLEGGYGQELYRRLAWGRPPRLRAQPLPAEVRHRSLRLQVIHTPGHAADHVCYYEPDREWLFTGDLFLAERLRYLRSDENVGELVSSLERVSALRLKRVFCAHRGPLRDGPAALRRKAEGLSQMRERIRALLRQGVGEKEIARRTVGPEGFLTWYSGGRFAARNFVRAVAHEDGAPG